MENNGIITGAIPSASNSIHKTYEESFFIRLTDGEKDNLFWYPGKYGLFFNNKERTVDVLEFNSEESSKRSKLEILNMAYINGYAILFEVIDANILHKHLMQEAYERQLIIDNNSKVL
ncbi:MAG: hypothetical protein IKR57_00110 [Bacilli bacterium]|nr:hypothetical protein [Bacilli bacterium]